MILSAHQPVYLPWLGFLHKIGVCDLFVVMDDVKFSRNSVYARNKIRSTNGEARWLTVPVTRESHDKPINQVGIASAPGWQIKHLNAIKAAYSASRFFQDYIGFFEWVYRGHRWKSLFELNRTILSQLLEWFDIRTPLVISSDYKMTGAKSERVLNYCLNFGAELYLFGKSGRQYAERGLFRKHGVHLAFQEYSHPAYDQGGAPFLANLSAIDLLFHQGPEAGRILMNQNVNKEVLNSLVSSDAGPGNAAGPALLSA